MKYITRENENGLWEVIIFNKGQKTVKVFSDQKIMKLWIWGNAKARKPKYNKN